MKTTEAITNVVKAGRKVLRVAISVPNESHDDRIFDFSHYGQRNEYVKLTSWALKRNATLTCSTAYVE